MSKGLESTKCNGYYRLSEDELLQMEAYCDRYKRFLGNSKTERTTVANAVRMLEANGFRPYEKGMSAKPGDRYYFNIRANALLAAVIGSRPLAEGVRMVASHVDSPRLDIRPDPLKEEAEAAYLQTHYYGWVRKYQWVSLPLMLQGIVYLADGTGVCVNIGADEADPVLVIPDLLPHMSAEQNKLPLSEAHTGEKLNVLVASRPLPDTDRAAAVKMRALRLLNERYGITEDDFLSAELEVVPAIPVRDVGLDRSLIGGYGQDDRVCGYAALDALCGIDLPEKTAVMVWADKEEVGNNGITGARSRSFDHCLDLLCREQNADLSDCYDNSFCLSGDVTAAYDPNYEDCFNKQNAAKLNYGIAVTKYTGYNGKEQASDAKGELLSYIRRLFDKHNVIWQSTEMSRIDLGGGGTVALEFANRGIDTLDGGVAVLGMHSPFEVVSKLDCYMTYKAYSAVFKG